MKQSTGLSFKWIVKAAVLVLILALPILVFADNVLNNVVAGGNDTITVGGSTTVSYRIQQTGAGNDGQAGCNAEDGSPATVTINAPAGVTATPGSLTFTACGTGAAQSVAFSSSAPGDHLITVSVTDSGNGSYDTSQATFTLHVLAPPNTPPSVSVTGVTNGASYEIGSVPAANCSVVDAEDGNSTFPATVSAISGPLAAYGLGVQTASCSYTDAGGLTAVASESYEIVDTIAPVITFVSRTSANGNGWNNSDVTVNWSCSDSGSGVVAAGVSQTLSAEGANQSATGTCEDHAGNTASDTQSGINVDLTLPTLNPSVSPNPAVLNGSASASANASDALSGIASASCGSVDTSSVGPKTVSCSATDIAGNANTGSASYSVQYSSGGLCLGAPGHAILEPVNAEGSSVFKKNSTVPLKFRVCDASGYSIGTAGVVYSFNLYQTMNGTAVATANEEIISTTPDNAFRWSASDQQWIFNLSTRNLTIGKTYFYRITLNDGTLIEFHFGVR